MDPYEDVAPEDFEPLGIPTDEEGDEMEAEFLAEMDRLERQHADDQSDDDDGMSDAEADSDTLRMAGMGTDEDYGYQGDGLD
jgi:hypothetical protein